MALIGTLRNKMTKWVVGFVAVAIISFILNDLFGNGPRSIIRGNADNLGEIAGSTITREEYQSVVQERENNYIMNFGRQPGERERPLIQQQAWELLIVQHSIRDQFEKTGVKVTSDELWDMIQGKNIDPTVKQSFVDSAGNFDRKKLIDFLNSMNVPMPTNPQLATQYNEQKYRWNMFQKELGLGRERVKYENLLIKTSYVTAAEAERDYQNQNDVAEVKYLFVPYYSVSDSTVKITESDLRDYYDKNREHYKSKFTRSLSYVSFPIIASAEDSAKIRKDAEKIAQDFKTVADDSVYAATNTEGQTPYTKYNVGNLPADLTKDKLVEGTVIGPYLDGNSFKVVKVVKIGKDTTYYAKASHILIKWADETDAKKKEAKDKARKILGEIKAGADFAAKAREFGTDGTASRGGDLGWFASGQMVKPFEKVVFDARKTGLIGDVIETQFGYHIIEVTGLKDNSYYGVATVELNVGPSDETQNAAFLKAQNFAAGLSGVDEFKEHAAKEKLNVSEAKNLAPADRRINNLGEARQIITWLFRDGKVGKVSEVFDVDDVYVVAVMTGETEEGYKSFAEVKDEITPATRNAVKGKQMVEKLAAQKGTLEEIAKLYGADAVVSTSSDLKMNANSLPSVGLDPIAIGVAFSLENGKRSKPFAGENGVILIEMQNKTAAPAINEFSMFKNELVKNLSNKATASIADAIKEGSNIKDERYKFF